MFAKIEELFKKSKELNYDELCGMKMVEEMRGPGFFPGCNGLDSNDSASLDKFILVVGQDFDNEVNYENINKEIDEVNSNTTWRNLRKILQDIEINPHECFFSNVYMGLRKKQEKNTGPSPAKKSKPFVKECESFFEDQLTIINPKLVLILGKEPANFISNLFPDYFSKWKKIKSLKQFYTEHENIRCNLEFQGKIIPFLFVIHPSMNGLNRSIIWKDIQEIETDILRKHLSSSPLLFKKLQPKF